MIPTETISPSPLTSPTKRPLKYSGVRATKLVKLNRLFICERAWADSAPRGTSASVRLSPLCIQDLFIGRVGKYLQLFGICTSANKKRTPLPAKLLKTAVALQPFRKNND